MPEPSYEWHLAAGFMLGALTVGICWIIESLREPKSLMSTAEYRQIEADVARSAQKTETPQ